MVCYNVRTKHPRQPGLFGKARAAPFHARIVRPQCCIQPRIKLSVHVELSESCGETLQGTLPSRFTAPAIVSE
jgi:hypothetical protein